MARARRAARREMLRDAGIEQCSKPISWGSPQGIKKLEKLKISKNALFTEQLRGETLILTLRVVIAVGGDTRYMHA